MKSLSQKKNFEKREYDLKDSKLIYRISKGGSTDEFPITYENIDGDLIDYKSQPLIWLVLSLLFFVGGIAFLLSPLWGSESDFIAGFLTCVGIGLMLILVYKYYKADYWKIKLSNNSFLFLHKNIPNKQEVDGFIDELFKKRNRYLIDSYATIDSNIGYENQLNNLKWLRSIEVLDETLYKEKYE